MLGSATWDKQILHVGWVLNSNWTLTATRIVETYMSSAIPLSMPTQEDGSDGPNSSAPVAQPEVRITHLACWSRATFYARPLATAPTTPTRRPRVAQNVSSKRRTQTPLLLIQISQHRNGKFFLFDLAAVIWNPLGVGSIILLLEKDKKTASVIMKSRTKIYANFTSKLLSLLAYQSFLFYMSLVTDIQLQLSGGRRETRAFVCRVPANSSRICDQTQTLAVRFASVDCWFPSCYFSDW